MLVKVLSCEFKDNLNMTNSLGGKQSRQTPRHKAGLHHIGCTSMGCHILRWAVSQIVSNFYNKPAWQTFLLPLWQMKSWGWVRCWGHSRGYGRDGSWTKSLKPRFSAVSYAAINVAKFTNKENSGAEKTWQGIVNSPRRHFTSSSRPTRANK